MRVFKLFLVLALSFPTLSLANDDWRDEEITVRAGDYFYFDAPEINKFGLQTFKDHFFAMWLFSWQQVDLNQKTSASLEMCIQELETGDIPCLDTGDFRGANDGSLWKPEGDPTASCRGRAVFLLPSSYSGRVGPVGGSIEILNSSFQPIDTGFFRGDSNPNRPTFCTTKTGGNYSSGPIYVRYTAQGVKECKRVRNPASREE